MRPPKRKRSQTKAAKKKAQPRIKRLLARGKQIAHELVARRKRVAGTRRRHRKQLVKELVGSYRSAQYLRESKGDWLEFCRHDEWDDFKHRPKPEDQQDSFKFVVRLFVGFGGKPATQRASLYYCALQPLFAADVPARKLPRLLREAGGFKKLAQSWNTGAETKDGDAEAKAASIRIIPNRHSEKLTEAVVDDRIVLMIRIKSVSSNRVDAEIVKTKVGPP